MIKGGGCYSSGLFLCDKALSCVYYCESGVFFLFHYFVCQKSPNDYKVQWESRNWSSFAGLETENCASSFQSSVHLVSFQKFWRVWHILCGSLMTTKSFTEGQYGKSWLGGKLIKHQCSSAMLPLATVLATSVTDNLIIILMASFLRIRI